MAIYHFSMQRISRGKGKSAVGSSAYRAGEKLKNKRDGLIHDYTKRNDVVHKEIITPYNAPEWSGDREILWNEVERSEKRKDANTAREINIALPKELNREKQIELVRNFVQENFTEKRIIADVAIHDKNDGNPHAHIMITTRAIASRASFPSYTGINQDGFDNKKISHMDDKETLEKWRENWAKEINKSLEKENIKERVDHRSFEDQGIKKIPTKHEGQAVRAMEKKGIETEIGSYNRQVEIANKQIELINSQIAVLERSLEDDRIESKVKKRETLKIDIKLPEKLNRENQIELVRNFVQENFTDKKIRADVVYNKKDEKQHVQIIINTRAINKDGLIENWVKEINKILKKEFKNIKDLQERQKQFIKYYAEIRQLEIKREGLKFFQIKKKKVIDEKIKEINQLKASDIESLNQIYKIEPNEIDSLIRKKEEEIRKKEEPQPEKLTLEEWRELIKKSSEERQTPDKPTRDRGYDRDDR
jgi:hypothetical protein